MTLDDLIDDTWRTLRANYFRRALLGKKQCAELVMLTVSEFPEADLQACAQGSDYEKTLVGELITRVASRFADNRIASGKQEYTFAFMSVILLWAVSAIVQHLVTQWWDRHFSAETIRAQYGWRSP